MKTEQFRKYEDNLRKQWKVTDAEANIAWSKIRVVRALEGHQ
jgi:hypothetical protein